MTTIQESGLFDDEAHKIASGDTTIIPALVDTLTKQAAFVLKWLE